MSAFSTLAAKFPVTEILLTVVDPNVDDPVVKIFPNAPIPETVVEPMLSAVTFPVPATKFASVVEPRVDEPVIAIFVPVKFEIFAFVAVALVIVPFVELTFVSVIPPTERFVIVAEVIVAFVPTAFTKFVVEAFVVVA